MADPVPEMVRRVSQAIERELNAMIEPGTTTTLWTLAEKAARAAIAEMRNPTEEMVDAPWRVNEVQIYEPTDLTQVLDCISFKAVYQAMIDEALRE